MHNLAEARVRTLVCGLPKGERLVNSGMYSHRDLASCLHLARWLCVLDLADGNERDIAARLVGGSAELSEGGIVQPVDVHPEPRRVCCREPFNQLLPYQNATARCARLDPSCLIHVVTERSDFEPSLGGYGADVEGRPPVQAEAHDDVGGLEVAPTCHFRRGELERACGFDACGCSS